MNQENLISHHLQVALEAAKKAGSYVLDADRKKQFKVSHKQTNDFVTDVDKKAEAIIIDYLKQHFPLDAIFGEESGHTEPSEHGRWIIDPIDGTTNFFRSMPNYTISIAWELSPFKPLVGVVFNPRQDELFWASEGRGAFLNAKPIRVSTVDDISRSLFVCVPPHRQHELSDGYFETAKKIFQAISDFRSFGSCALELSYIAAGRLDGYYELCLGYYDMAAGMIIVKEAGGSVSSCNVKVPFSDERCDIVASNGLIHNWILHMVQS